VSKVFSAVIFHTHVLLSSHKPLECVTKWWCSVLNRDRSIDEISESRYSNVGRAIWTFLDWFQYRCRLQMNGMLLNLCYSFYFPSYYNLPHWYTWNKQFKIICIMLIVYCNHRVRWYSQFSLIKWQIKFSRWRASICIPGCNLTTVGTASTSVDPLNCAIKSNWKYRYFATQLLYVLQFLLF